MLSFLKAKKSKDILEIMVNNFRVSKFDHTNKNKISKITFQK